MNKLQIFVGWDPREDIAWEVCRHSILSRTNSNEVCVYPLKQAELRQLGLYTRPVDSLASTEFSLTRFLTPTLAGEVGFAIFMDCDFLITCDIRDVFREIDPSAGVSVVKHDFTPRSCTKMDGKVQHAYPRKNWSSFMVFNLEHDAVRSLTPSAVNQRTPAYLHRLQWINDRAIGALDKSWNHLVGVYPRGEMNPRAIHFTEGGPWFDDYRGCEFAENWRNELYQWQGTIRHSQILTAHEGNENTEMIPWSKYLGVATSLSGQ